MHTLLTAVLHGYWGEWGVKIGDGLTTSTSDSRLINQLTIIAPLPPAIQEALALPRAYFYLGLTQTWGCVSNNNCNSASINISIRGNINISTTISISFNNDNGIVL